jgi:hypothetical protein
MELMERQTVRAMQKEMRMRQVLPQIHYLEAEAITIRYSGRRLVMERLLGEILVMTTMSSLELLNLAMTTRSTLTLKAI